MLQTGFSKLDITPPLGINLAGYFFERPAEDILDPLYAIAVAFDDGEKKAVVLSVDNLGINALILDAYRENIAKACDLSPDAVYIACTHTHLGPDLGVLEGKCKNPEYAAFLGKRLCDAATLAFLDLAPTKMLQCRGEVKDVAFVRRYRMRDGSARTNPGFLNPDILHPEGSPDEECALLILKREGKPEIGIVNFQVHPDCIGGCKISADYPKFVRDTYEKLIDNSRCMYINGAQGDTNHIDVRLGEDKCRKGYDRIRYMGRKIAMAAVSNYELAEEISGDEIKFARKGVIARHNRGKAEEIEPARELMNLHAEYGDPNKIPNIAERFPMFKGNPNVQVAAARRIASLQELPEERKLWLSALAIGDVVFAGFPGEPFTEIGRSVKKNSRFALTIPSCTTNGYEGYFPMMDSYDEEGYEKSTARFVRGAAEKLIDEMTDLINSLN